MPRSRVQKGKTKKSKLPLWGLGVIVVLVVVIAGYAIVRFSEAGTRHSYHTPLDGKISGGGTNFTINKNGTTETFRKVTSSSPVKTKWYHKDSCLNTSLGYDCSRSYNSGDDWFYRTDEQGCARIYLEGNSAGTLTFSFDIPGFLNLNRKSYFSLGQATADIRTLCINIDTLVADGLRLRGGELNAKITLEKGTVGVTNFHLVGADGYIK
jgi:hypothetical protein